VYPHIDLLRQKDSLYDVSKSTLWGTLWWHEVISSLKRWEVSDHWTTT
jgi:hypothetical protein